MWLSWYSFLFLLGWCSNLDSHNVPPEYSYNANDTLNNSCRNDIPRQHVAFKIQSRPHFVPMRFVLLIAARSLAIITASLFSMRNFPGYFWKDNFIQLVNLTDSEGQASSVYRSSGFSTFHPCRIDWIGAGTYSVPNLANLSKDKDAKFPA